MVTKLGVVLFNQSQNFRKMENRTPKQTLEEINSYRRPTQLGRTSEVGDWTAGAILWQFLILLYAFLKKLEPYQFFSIKSGDTIHSKEMEMEAGSFFT